MIKKFFLIFLKKDKERISKAARENQQVVYKGTPIRHWADFSAETLQARRVAWYIQCWKDFEGEVKSFTENQKLNKLGNTNQIYKKC